MRTSRLTVFLVGAGRQPRDQRLEVARELRAGTRERDALHARPVLGAAQPAPPRVDLKPPGPQIKMAPDRVDRPGVAPGPGAVAAERAHKPPAAQSDLDHHPARLEPDLLDPHAL